jgi:hypothetical protein
MQSEQEMKVMANSSTVVDNRGWFKRQFENLPEWARTVVFFAVVGFVLYMIATRRELPVVNVTPPAPVAAEVKQAEPDAVEGRRWNPAQKLFVDLVKHRAKKALTADGFNLIGGSPKKLTEEEADRLLSFVDEETILQGAKDTGILKDSGSVLDRLSNLIDWLLSHKDQINQLVKWLLEILQLFT